MMNCEKISLLFYSFIFFLFFKLCRESTSVSLNVKWGRNNIWIGQHDRSCPQEARESHSWTKRFLFCRCCSCITLVVWVPFRFSSCPLYFDYLCESCTGLWFFFKLFSIIDWIKKAYPVTHILLTGKITCGYGLKLIFLFYNLRKNDGLADLQPVVWNLMLHFSVKKET